jgi:formylglycine-generating enzyme required for sulfatase activity
VLGQTIGRYYVRRLLGKGGMGRVYLARDSVLGRSVALKLVGRAVDGELILDEARAIAKLNHPNIVQLYDFDKHGPGVYLALEYVEGDTLRERLLGGRIERDEALRYSHAIANALTHAHEAGVFHCDLKPSNVMVGRDGRIRVVDFGIARTAGNDDAAAVGTPDWMAPEQWSAVPLTDRVDVWALAIVSAQLLTGRHPLGDDAASRRAAARDPERVGAPSFDPCDLPGAIADLIVRSLAHVPELRPSALDWVHALDDIINRRGDAFSEDPPYPGLAAFDEHQARFYFGREREIDEFLERLRDAPYLPIAGPSGSGKSSFLQAGVIPRLRARERWTVISFRPGADPIAALARRVIAAMGDHGSAAEPRQRERIKTESRAFHGELLENPRLLAVRLATLAATRQSRVLLAVDQLEEVFTQCASELERGRFLRMLLGAADDPLDPVRIVFTVRDDFLGKIAGFRDELFGRLAGLRSLFVMQKLDDNDLRRTITGPLARHHYAFDDATLVQDLIDEVGSAEVADLPLLQFACRTLWDGRDIATRTLRRATYREMGGLAGALAQHAERALAEMAPDEKRITRQVLLQLVSGTTRRSLARDHLVAAVGRNADAVIDRLLGTRLLVTRSPGEGDGAVVEIAHESLLQTWSQLARWVEESRDERRLLAELDDATSLWERRGKRSEETWSHDALSAARHRASQLDLIFPPRVEAFLAAGEQRHRAQLRKRRVRYGVLTATAGIVAAIAFTLVARYLAREQLIRANAGIVDLAVMPFDWIDGTPRPVPINQLPDLSWKLYAAKQNDAHEPGEAISDSLVEVLSQSNTGNQRTWRVQAPGGTEFLRIDGRGRAGERCAASWIRIQAFPGYTSASGIARIELELPTCQATRTDTIVIEAGPFIYGGPGEPASRYAGKPDYDEPEQRIDLEAFAIDRTEVSNAAYALFARMEKVNGYVAPIYADDTLHAHDSDPNYPVTEIDAFQAEAYCQFLGKQLPGDYQWVKAARGGLTIGGEANRFPHRLYPWGNQPDPRCANDESTDDGYEWLAPVDALPCGASPYGVLNLAGNVQEWIGRAGQTDAKNPLYALRGGGADSPATLEHTTTVYRNHKDPRAFNYSVGFRCVSSSKENFP